MNWLTLLTIEYVFFMLLSLAFSRGRLVTPGVLFFASFSVMLLSSMIFSIYLEIRLKDETFWIMSAAGLTFLLVEQAYHFLSVSTVKTKDRGNWIVSARKPIVIQRMISNILVTLMVLSLLFSLYDLFTSYGSYSNFNELMHANKEARTYSQGKDLLNFFFMNQVLKICKATAYVCSYILMYNKAICKVPLLKQKKLLIIILLFIPTTALISSGRKDTIEIILFIILTYILLIPLSGKKLKLLPLLIKGSLFLVAFVLLFTISASWVGRADKYRDPIYYFIDYLCGGIINFNSEVGRTFNYKYWGQASFAAIFSLLNKYEIVPDDAVLTFHSFGWTGEYAPTTTVTIFGRWYEDFGGVGVCVMTGIVALFFSYLLYSKIDKRKVPNLFQIIYLKLSMALVWASFDDRVYTLISSTEIFTITLIGMLYWLLVGRGSRYKFIFGTKSKRRIKSAAHYKIGI